jgi:hypothetical protein
VASKGRPHRSVIVEGFEVLIGRGDRENDRLTFEVAEPHDLWLHVGAGVAGSHVVVRNPDKLDALPKDVVRRAAELAAWHSKARDARRRRARLPRERRQQAPRRPGGRGDAPSLGSSARASPRASDKARAVTSET